MFYTEDELTQQVAILLYGFADFNKKDPKQEAQACIERAKAFSTMYSKLIGFQNKEDSVQKVNVENAKDFPSGGSSSSSGGIF